MKYVSAWIAALAMSAVLLAACGGGGGSSTPPPVSNVTVNVSGRISFDRVPFKATAGMGLEINNAIEALARSVVVEAIDSGSNAVLATATSNNNGNYTLAVPANRDLFVRAKAQMLFAGAGPSWNFRILNNVNANALYTLDGQPFNSGTTDSTRNLRATSGWNGTTYAGVRSAAPFAILDTVYQAKELLLSAKSDLVMPALDLYWSASNRPAGPFCPANGNISSTAYQRSTTNGCTPNSISSGGIYVQGDFANGSGDTDEFDQSVLAHEFGHYVEDLIARSDTIGGSHGIGARMDMRVAFSEGWGNAFAAMVLNDPIYRDSFGGVSSDFNENIEASSDPNAGWFSESTVQQVLWDVFDAANEAGDGVTLGFLPIYQTMVGPQRTTLALTDLHTFATGLKANAPTAASAIDALLTAPPRNITGTGDFATGETNNGSQPLVLPIYTTLSLNQLTAPICTTAQFGSYNRLANRRFLVFDLSAPTTATVIVTASPGSVGSQAAQDPDFVVWRQGVRVLLGLDFSTGSPPVEQHSIQLTAGSYVLEVYDYRYANPAATVNDSTQRCMTVQITG